MKQKPFIDDAVKTKLNEQISRLLVSERRLYDTQGELDLQLTRMGSLNQLSLSISPTSDVSNVLEQALSFIVTNFVTNYAVGLIYETNTSRLIASGRILRGRPVENISLELKNLNLSNIGPKQNIIITIVDAQTPNVNDPIIDFARKCFATVFDRQIQFEKDARILLVSNSFENVQLKTYLLCYCVPPAMIGYRERTLQESDRSFLNLFCKQIGNIIGSVLYQKNLRKFANELETKVTERTNELKHRLEFEEVIAKIAQYLSQKQFNEIQGGLEEIVKMIGLFLDADRVSIFLFSEDHKIINVIQQWCSVGVAPYTEIYNNFPSAQIPHIYKSIMSGDVYQITDVDFLPADWSSDVKVLKQAGVISFISIPLISLNKCIGFASIAYMQAKQALGKDDMSLFRTFGELIVVALERQKSGEQLDLAAKYDALTGLPNRFQFEIIINNDMSYAKRNNQIMALLSLDLDGFKNVNDIYGHDVGDLLLKEVSTRIKACIRGEDFVARVGGDEFIILVVGMKDPGDAGTVAQKILASMKQECQLNGHSIFISSSIGIACFPIDGTNSVTLVKNADIAMYQAKSRGGDRFQFLTEDLQNRNQKRIHMESALQTAIKNNEFYMLYQPQFDLNKNIIGMEALLRWNNPIVDLNSTKELIMLAEDCGQIFAIGEWVFRTVFAQRNEWQKIDALKNRKIAINLSFREFEVENLCNRIMKVVAETNTTPSDFEFELAETVLMHNPQYSMQELNCLHRDGFNIVVDNFGTGCSSLYYLKIFPLKSIKVDKGFVKNIGVKKEDEIVIVATISLARQLGLDVMAEGVETKEQLQFLIDHGCKKFQGYYFSHPLKVEEVTQLLIKGSGSS